MLERIVKDVALDTGLLRGNPPVSWRFVVTFFIGGLIPNPLDIRFKRVSGLSVETGVKEFREGGENLYAHRLPEGVKYSNLQMERGLIKGSLLNYEFIEAMNRFQFNPGNVMVTLLGASPLLNPHTIDTPGNMIGGRELSQKITNTKSNVSGPARGVAEPHTVLIPTAGWLFKKAWPVKWSTSDLDGESNTVVIDTMELAFSHFETMRL